MERHLTIGFDATRLDSKRTGIENYVYHLLMTIPEALAAIPRARVIAFVPAAAAGGLSASLPASEQVSLITVRAGHPIIREQVGTPLAMLSRGIRLDLFHSTGFPAPLWSGARRRLVTMHDIVFKTHPETMRMGRKYWQALAPLVLRRADAIVVDSQFVADELREQYPSATAKPIQVIPLGLDDDWLGFRPDSERRQGTAARHGLPRNYVAWVGALQPRKNLPFLIDVVAEVRRLSSSWSNLGIVLIGARGWKSDSIGARIRERGLERDVVFPGYVSDEELRDIIAGARAFLFPSLHEGFGLPPIEAMACGTPVLTSTEGALPEVVQDGGLVLPLSDPRAWVEGLTRVLDDPAFAERLRQQGRARASQLTWKACARQTVETYRSMLGL